MIIQKYIYISFMLHFIVFLIVSHLCCFCYVHLYCLVLLVLYVYILIMLHYILPYISYFKIVSYHVTVYCAYHIKTYSFRKPLYSLPIHERHCSHMTYSVIFFGVLRTCCDFSARSPIRIRSPSKNTKIEITHAASKMTLIGQMRDAGLLHLRLICAFHYNMYRHVYI